MRAAAISSLGVTLVLSAALPPQPAQAATSPTRALAELSPTDREAMERARNEVLETMMPGATSIWKDDRTGHSGEARLLRRYERNGMSCGEVEHILKIRQVSRYVVPLCRASDGTWRLAF